MKLLLLVILGLSSLLAEEAPELRAAKHHFDLAATRASANFRSLDSVDARLAADGLVIHPRFTALRMRVEAALSEARFDIDQRDYPAAEDALTRAEALLDRFAKEFGGY